MRGLRLRGHGALVGFPEWDGAKGKGVDDHLATVGPDVGTRARPKPLVDAEGRFRISAVTVMAPGIKICRESAIYIWLQRYRS